MKEDDEYVIRHTYPDGTILETHHPRTLYFPCSRKVRNQIYRALRKQAEDRIVQKLVESAEGVEMESENGGPNHA
jgi:hypothetical protein